MGCINKKGDIQCAALRDAATLKISSVQEAPPNNSNILGAPTGLSGFVDRFVRLHQVNESRRLNEDFCCLACYLISPLEVDFDSCHSFGAHLRDLWHKENTKDKAREG